MSGSSWVRRVVAVMTQTQPDGLGCFESVLASWWVSYTPLIPANTLAAYVKDVNFYVT